MKRLIAVLAGLAAFTLAAPALAANSHAHPGWQHNPRNPHYVKVVPLRPGPTGTCLEWVINNKLGDPPVCVKWA
jgi:hypothetical protein